MNTDSSDLLICCSLAGGFACAGASPGAENWDGKRASDETMETTLRKCWKNGQRLEESNIAVVQQEAMVLVCSSVIFILRQLGLQLGKSVFFLSIQRSK